MIVEVVFLPPIAATLPSKLCIVIDVLRATSTLVAMFESGVRRIELAATIADALAQARAREPRPLVCGESGGLPPEGFDRGNSPREYERDSLAGQEIVFFTSNGTKALRRVAESPVVLTGSLLNARAVVRRALAKARERRLNIALVCSGDFVGTQFAIDDAFCAGCLCALLAEESGTPVPVGADGVRVSPAARGGADTTDGLHFDESALAAMRLARSFATEAGGRTAGVVPPREAILTAFWESHNAAVLDRVGLAEDVEYCAQVDISTVVPRLAVEGGVLALYPS